jgi:putative tryptophan/tyrosine transport system substrate-binding protein
LGGGVAASRWCAQQPARAYRIGVLKAGPLASTAHLEKALTEALRELGWVEGKNIVFEYRYADNQVERLPGLAAELVRLKVDAIVASGTAATRDAKEATSTIPIVMIGVGDPVEIGLIASLARPGGNVTGLSFAVSAELGSKRLQLLKQIVPGLSRVAMLWNATNPGSANVLKDVKGAAEMLGIEVHSVTVRSSTDWENAYEAVAKQRPDALILAADPLLLSHRKQITDFATKNKLPAIYSGGSTDTPCSC